jgi:hypothetical protein
VGWGGVGLGWGRTPRVRDMRPPSVRSGRLAGCDTPVQTSGPRETRPRVTSAPDGSATACPRSLLVLLRVLSTGPARLARTTLEERTSQRSNGRLDWAIQKAGRHERLAHELRNSSAHSFRKNSSTGSSSSAGSDTAAFRHIRRLTGWLRRLSNSLECPDSGRSSSRGCPALRYGEVPLQPTLAGLVQRECAAPSRLSTQPWRRRCRSSALRFTARSPCRVRRREERRGGHLRAGPRG